jgi:hypothetical protein
VPPKVACDLCDLATLKVGIEGVDRRADGADDEARSGAADEPARRRLNHESHVAYEIVEGL